MENLAIVDIETTGGRPTFDRVIEVGVILIKKGQVTKQWSSLVNPHRSISPLITSITGITQSDVEFAPDFRQIHEELLALLKDHVFIAHNVRFDYSFLRSEFARVGVTLHMPHACSVRLSRLLYPQQSRHNLDSIIDRLQLSVRDRHRALDDAFAVWQFLEKARLTLGDQTVDRGLAQIIARPAMPSYITDEQIQKLPNGPGVYLFYGHKGELLYVGKSIHIKERVLSHFYADLSVVKELRIKEHIRAIETITTAGELGALLQESQLVKKLQPLYNQKLKQPRMFTVLTLTHNHDGYLEVTKIKTRIQSVDDLEGIYGLFKSSRMAENTLVQLARDQQLCLKLLSLEKGKGPCFGYHLEQCKGACIGKESALVHNQRLERAFEKLKIMHWPFKQPIVISEYNEDTQQSAHHVFYRWCHLGTVDSEADLEDLVANKPSLTFDLDTYNILKHQLQTKPLQVTPIPYAY